MPSTGSEARSSQAPSPRADPIPKETPLSTRPTSAPSRRDRRAARRDELRSHPHPNPQRRTSTGLGVAVLSVAAVLAAVVFAVVLAAQGSPSTRDATGDGLDPPGAQRPAAVALDDRALGPRDAAVVVELWEDFQCPACSRFTALVEPSIVERFVSAGDVRIVFRDFAFLGTESTDAAVAARCAGEQTAFWPYHDWLYANQNGENAGWFSGGRLAAIADRVGLDRPAFDACVGGAEARSAVATETAAGRALGIDSTPTIVVDGAPYRGATTDDLLATIQTAVDAAR